MVRERKSSAALFGAISVCGPRTDEISRCVLVAISAILREYPAQVDISAVLAGTSEGGLARRTIEMLIQQQILTGSDGNVTLTLRGYRAVKKAKALDLRLTKFFHLSPKPTSFDHASLLLSILRAHVRSPLPGDFQDE